MSQSSRVSPLHEDHFEDTSQALAVAILCTSYAGDSNKYSAGAVFRDATSRITSYKCDLSIDEEALKRAFSNHPGLDYLQDCGMITLGDHNEQGGNYIIYGEMKRSRKIGFNKFYEFQGKKVGREHSMAVAALKNTLLSICSSSRITQQQKVSQKQTPTSNNTRSKSSSSAGTGNTYTTPAPDVVRRPKMQSIGSLYTMDTDEVEEVEEEMLSSVKSTKAESALNLVIQTLREELDQFCQEKRKNLRKESRNNDIDESDSEAEWGDDSELLQYSKALPTFQKILYETLTSISASRKNDQAQKNFKKWDEIHSELNKKFAKVQSAGISTREAQQRTAKHAHQQTNFDDLSKAVKNVSRQLQIAAARLMQRDEMDEKKRRLVENSLQYQVSIRENGDDEDERYYGLAIDDEYGKLLVDDQKQLWLDGEYHKQEIRNAGAEKSFYARDTLPIIAKLCMQYAKCGLASNKQSIVTTIKNYTRQLIKSLHLAAAFRASKQRNKKTSEASSSKEKFIREEKDK